jgi:membrane carboxypeptidase/penicillin-binding protein
MFILHFSGMDIQRAGRVTVPIFRAGAFGVSAVARIYSGKRLAELSVAEAAVLAGLIKAPSEYNPIRNRYAIS